jgi:cytochrome c556
MRRWSMGLGAALLVASGHAQAPMPTLHEVMKNRIAPQAQILWDVSNAAMDDDGKADPTRMTDAQWTKVAAAGRTVEEMARTLATAKHVMVAPAGIRIDGEGSPGASTAAQVQAYIDANPAGFAEDARKLAAAAAGIAAAAKARDTVALVELGGNLDQVCETCHMRFWSPPPAGN